MNNKESRTLENSNKHIDNWLSQQFEDFTPNPDAGLWQSIDAALDRKERRSKFIWYWLAAGVLLSVLGVGAVQWNLKNTNHPAKPVVAQTQTESPVVQGHSKTETTPSAKSQQQSNRSLALESPAVEESTAQGGVTTQNRPTISSRNKLSTFNNEMSSSNLETPIGEELNALNREAYVSDLSTKDFVSQWVDNANNGSKSVSAEDTKLPWQRLSRKPLMPGRWSVEVGADANQTGLMYRAKSDYGNYIHKNYFERMRSGEFALSASRIHGAVLFQLSAKHSVKLGLAYAENRTQQRFDFRDSMPATVIQGQTADALGYYPIFGYLGLGPQVSFQSQNTYTMLSIPMGYTGHFPWRKGLSITPEVLVSANRLGMSAGAQTLDYQTLLQKAQSPEQFRAWVMGLRLAVGVEKRLNYSHAIGLRLNAQSMLSPMYVPNAALESRGWSAGLSAHYSWRIQ